MNYLLEVHDTNPTDHVTRTCCFQADTGIRAARCARRIVKARGGSYGDLSFRDGTGQYIPYKTIGGSR